MDNYPDAMSNVGEIITAVTQLSPAEQWDLYQWLNESPAITRRRLDALREDVALGLAQADRGDVAPLDIEAEQMLRRQPGPPPPANGGWRFPEGRHLGPFRAPVEDWRLLANETAAD